MAEEKKLGDLNRTEKTAIILQALLKEGFNQNQASKLLDVTRGRISHVNKKINQGVLNPLVKKAKKSVALLLEGKPVGAMTAVKGADVLMAAKMVLDRADPVVNKVESTNIAISYEIKPEERERYKAALGIIDAEYEVVGAERPPLLLTAEEVEVIEESSNGRTRGFEPLNEGSIPSSSSSPSSSSEEQLPCKQPVEGSIPSLGSSNNNRDIAQLDQSTPFGAEESEV